MRQKPVHSEGDKGACGVCLMGIPRGVAVSGEAARYGDSASIRALLEAGAEIEAEIPKNGQGWTAMVSAYTAGRSEIVAILKEAGARDDRVTAATGEPLTDDSAPMQTVRAYLAAIQVGDVQTMKRARPDRSSEWFEQIDFETWAETKKLEAIYQQKLADLDELKKSVLHKAFEGEL